MFDNIGKKIKGIAQLVFIVVAFVAVVSGIILMLNGDELIIFGIATWIIGIIGAWVFACFTYGFGELIDKTCDIERRIAKEQGVQDQQNNGATPEIAAEQRAKRVYRCYNIEEGEMLKGTCAVCREQGKLLRRCKIENEIGTRNIPVCLDCISRFKKNARPD